MRAQRILREAGHDVLTVRDQHLQGAFASLLYDACQTEQRCLLTLDLDFADVLRFPLEDTAGVVVIRPGRNPSLALLESLVQQLLLTLDHLPIASQLWIVEIGRICIRQRDDDD